MEESGEIKGKTDSRFIIDPWMAQQISSRYSLLVYYRVGRTGKNYKWTYTRISLPTKCFTQQKVAAHGCVEQRLVFRAKRFFMRDCIRQLHHSSETMAKIMPRVASARNCGASALIWLMLRLAA